ncbi:MAG: ABC transporter ATP-binding protein [Merdibacter sp.]
MAKPISNKRPDNFWKTLRNLLHYMGNHRFLLLLVAILVAISALANLLGTYMLKPIVNEYIVPRDVQGLFFAVLVTAGIYGAGVLASFGYTQIMVVVAQRIIKEIREDLFHRMMTLPLRYFDTNPNGDTMSRFTNDVDTISDALNNSFAMLVQSFIQIAGTLTLIFLLNWQLSIIVLLCYILMFAYIQFSGKRSRYYFGHQQKYLGSLNGFIEEMIRGQKVVKVFNHEGENMEEFRRRNKRLRRRQPVRCRILPRWCRWSFAFYINYAIVAVLGGIMAITAGPMSALWQYLVFVRQCIRSIVTQQANLILVALSGAERIFTMEETPESMKGSRDNVAVTRMVHCMNAGAGNGMASSAQGWQVELVCSRRCC